MRYQSKFFLLFFTLICACVEPFDAPVNDKEVGFLVVDGYVNTSSHSVSVKLSRAVALTSTEGSPSEENAQITLEGESGTKYPLNALGNGNYYYTSPDITTGKTYRLRIIRSNGREYQSDYVTTKASPPIDSLTWDAEEEGINIRVNTHDTERKSQYYRWDFTETWEYQASFFSSLIVKDGALVTRPTDQSIYICYKSENANVISTASTVDLNEDRISGVEIAYIPKFSQKYSRHYSILVKQYVLTKEGHDYWQQLKVSSENLGGLFDPQPSRVTGNIRSLNSDEPVIGYFDGGEVQEKRLFFKFDEVPDSFKVFPRSDCEELQTTVGGAALLPDFYLITSAIVFGGRVIGYNYAVAVCADCRALGGVTTKPDFWP